MKQKFLSLVGLALFFSAVLGITSTQGVSAIRFNVPPPPPPKITICHATNSATNPYVKQTVNLSSIFNVPNGHFYHTGPLATSVEVAMDLKDDKIDWGDIIPGLLNWTNEGQAIYNNDCAVANIEVEPTAPTFVNPTCDVDPGYYTIPEVEGVEYQVNSQAVAAGDYYVTSGEEVTITAVALEGYELTGDTEWTHTFVNDDICVVDEEAAIKYSVTCSDDGAVVAFTNQGNTDGEVTLNGEVITVGVSETVSRTIANGKQVTITVDQEVVYDEVADCEGEILGVTTLPKTSGEFLAGALAFVAGLGVLAVVASRGLHAVIR